jgi:methylenetetrahydrofolate reductase (NADPH)
MQNYVPGMIVRDEWIDGLKSAVADIPKEDKKARREALRKKGIEMCVEQIKELREMEGVAGVHIMAIEWEEAVRPIVEDAGLLPRPQVE